MLTDDDIGRLFVLDCAVIAINYDGDYAAFMYMRLREREADPIHRRAALFTGVNGNGLATFLVDGLHARWGQGTQYRHQWRDLVPTGDTAGVV